MGLFDRFRLDEPAAELVSPTQLEGSYRNLPNQDSNGLALLEGLIATRGPAALSRNRRERHEQLVTLRHLDPTLAVVTARDFGVKGSARALPLLKALQQRLGVDSLVRDAGPGIGQVISRLALEALDKLELAWDEVNEAHPSEVRAALGIRTNVPNDALEAVYKHRVENLVADITSEIATKAQERVASQPELEPLTAAPANGPAERSPEHSL